jgi:hypothetical protein
MQIRPSDSRCGGEKSRDAAYGGIPATIPKGLELGQLAAQRKAGAKSQRGGPEHAQEG